MDTTNMTAAQELATALDLCAHGTPHATFSGIHADGALAGCAFSARADLCVIASAWRKGCDLEAECDGYGKGLGTMGDWSGIRDSSEEAVAEMLTKAIRHLAGQGGTR